MLYVIITLKNFRQRQIKFFSKSYRNTYKVLHVYLLTFQSNILVAWMLKEREKQRCEKRRVAAPLKIRCLCDCWQIESSRQECRLVMIINLPLWENYDVKVCPSDLCLISKISHDLWWPLKLAREATYWMSKKFWMESFLQKNIRKKVVKLKGHLQCLARI